MALKGAEQVLFFDAFFVALLVMFGSTISGVSFGSLSTITPPPTTTLPTVNCGGLCSPFTGIVQATAYIGWAIVNLPVLLGYLIVVTITFLNIVLAITFSPGLSAQGVPVVGFFFLAVQMIVFFEVFRIFRGSASGF